MIAAAIILGSAIAIVICAILRAPLGFQTDRGFFYGLPDAQESEREIAAEHAALGIGGAADFVPTHDGEVANG